MDFDAQKLTFKHAQHRNQQVIFCLFPYDPKLLKDFRNAFPSAKWSRTNKAWFVPDNTLYRKRLGIQLPEQGIKYMDRMYSVNQIEFRKFRDVLQQKMFSKNTVETYLSEFAQLLILIKAKPVLELTSEQLNSYFLYCIKKLNHSENQVYSRMNAVKCYFKLVMNKESVFDTVIRPKAPITLPTVLSKQEIIRLFAQTDNFKHLLLLKMAYGMGLRVSELIALEIGDIDLDRKQVHIRNAKGKKDRYVNLPESIQQLYADYLMAFQPKKYLFEGQFGGAYSTRSAQAVFKQCLTKAGITKKIGIHGLRHSFATHLLEVGTDMLFIQKLLGHKQIKTTEIYARVSSQQLSKVKSPLDCLDR
ncbi:MAG: tyrosine-type recombinase/integrase [Fluviicola sp.]|nr:tyrosine-type recombinase/integrase [Fluviicola sp.]